MKPDQPCLVIDGSARAGVRVGVLSDGRWTGQGVSPEGALEATFACAEQALSQAGLKLADIRSFAVCAGPGSVLGIRVSALAVRAWAVLQPRPIFVWQSLSALAADALRAGIAAPFSVAQESRLRRWNHLKVDAAGVFSEVTEVSAEELRAAAPKVVTDQPGATAVFPDCLLIDHPWERLPVLFIDDGLLRAEDKPEALNTAADFAAWSGERHRGPA